jgi:hypothetical protein
LLIDVNRWDEKAGLRRDAVGSQVIDIGSTVGRNVVAPLPNSWQEHKMRIPGNTKIQPILDYLFSTTWRDHPS